VSRVDFQPAGTVGIATRGRLEFVPTVPSVILQTRDALMSRKISLSRVSRLSRMKKE
jgi:hypothetical protein